MLVRAGVTVIVLMLAVPVPVPATVSVVDDLMLPTAAEMLDVPAANAFANPPAAMVAIPVADEVQAALAVTSLVVPSLNVAIAVYCRVAFGANDAFAGFTAIETTVGFADPALVTVNIVAPVTAPIFAAMLLAPAPAPVASPVVVIVATSGREVFHSEMAVTLLKVPSLIVAVALNWIVLL